MVWFLWSLLSTVQAAEPCETRFAFAGQPDCVDIAYANAHTRVTNRCEQALLLDQSVQPQFRVVGAGETVVIADLSAFTLGIDGNLYRAVARPVQVCSTAASEALAAPSSRRE